MSAGGTAREPRGGSRREIAFSVGNQGRVALGEVREETEPCPRDSMLGGCVLY